VLAVSWLIVWDWVKLSLYVYVCLGLGKTLYIILIINGLGERVVKFVDYCVAWVSEWLSLLTSVWLG
jgi:hypothetical protein